MLIILGFTSDLTRIRFPFICLGFAFTFIGFIIYAAIQDVHAQVRVLTTITTHRAERLWRLQSFHTQNLTALEQQKYQSRKYSSS